MATWPTSLPKPSPDSFQEEFPDNLIRTPMEVGPSKVRRRATSAVRKFSLSFDMNNDQLNILDAFCNTTIEGGALTFEMADPRNETMETWRMVSPPVISALSPVHFRATIELERMP